MNITAFHDYLDTCFFQTIQMKQVNYLTLKKKKQNWLGGHTSCLIDEGFRKQNCIMSAEEKKRMKDDIKKAKKDALKKKKQKKVQDSSKINEHSQINESERELIDDELPDEE